MRSLPRAHCAGALRLASGTPLKDQWCSCSSPGEAQVQTVNDDAREEAQEQAVCGEAAEGQGQASKKAAVGSELGLGWKISRREQGCFKQ